MAGARDWHTRPERGAIWGMRITAWLYHWIGAASARILLYPIITYFFLTGAAARRASMDYLCRLYHSPGGATALGAKPSWRMVFRHFLEFGHVTLDRLGFWLGRHQDFHFSITGMEHLDNVAEQGRGALIIGAHVGSFDAMRLMADLRSPISVNVLMYTRNAPRINALLESLGSDDGRMKVRAIQVEPGSFTHALEAKACIERGEVVAVLGDRLHPNEGDRGVPVTFLDGPALLPQGPMLLAGVLRCPVLLMIGLRVGTGSYHVDVERFADRIHIPRRERSSRVAEYCQVYADRLAHYCRKAPFQWFNFYPFWQVSGPTGG
jgi:predicted LPLAT superfamily acyltransferase